MNLFGSICLSDIDKELITVGKNGKKYLSIEIIEKQNSPDPYGRTHYIKTYVPKEKRDPTGAKKPNYIGDAKPGFDYGNSQQQTVQSPSGQYYTSPIPTQQAANQQNTTVNQQEEDLPF